MVNVALGSNDRGGVLCSMALSNIFWNLVVISIVSYKRYPRTYRGFHYIFCYFMGRYVRLPLTLLYARGLVKG